MRWEDTESGEVGVSIRKTGGQRDGAPHRAPGRLPAEEDPQIGLERRLKRRNRDRAPETDDRCRHHAGAMGQDCEADLDVHLGWLDGEAIAEELLSTGVIASRGGGRGARQDDIRVRHLAQIAWRPDTVTANY
jgi:hypothetical protein